MGDEQYLLGDGKGGAVLILQYPERGATLIELIISIVIMALLFAMGLPAFMNWIQSVQIRTATESIQNGLQLARATAVQRNTNAGFYLTNNMGVACALSAAGPNWIVGLADPTGACNALPSDVTPPFIIQARSASEGSQNAVIAAGQSSVVFNGAGRVTPPPAGNIEIDISNPTGGACATAGGEMRCLRIYVSPGGQVRMCDPALPNTTARGC
jgi:type IV fimbrial biogenesis protein FimT